MWSFVGNKGNKQWIWLALNVETREIVGVYVGDRSCKGAQGLWDALPAVYRHCAVAYTDFWSAYDEIFPSKRHQSMGKDSGKTSHKDVVQGEDSSLIQDPNPATLMALLRSWTILLFRRAGHSSISRAIRLFRHDLPILLSFL